MLGQQIEVGFLAGNPTFFIAYVLVSGFKKVHILSGSQVAPADTVCVKGGGGQKDGKSFPPELP